MKLGIPNRESTWPRELQPWDILNLMRGYRVLLFSECMIAPGTTVIGSIRNGILGLCGFWTNSGTNTQGWLLDLARPGGWVYIEATTGAPITSMMGSTAGGLSVDVATPSLSPWCAWRSEDLEAAASLTVSLRGFISAISATPNGAYVRRVGNGNLFFVTRQGAGETVTDLGVIAGVHEWDVFSPDAGVTWICLKDNVQVASHNTNVPTAATRLGAGIAAIGSLTAGNSIYVDWLLVGAAINL